MALFLFFASGVLLDAIEIVTQYGPCAGLLVLAVLFSMQRDWKRESRLTKRIGKLEDEIRNVLLPFLNELTVVISRNTVVVERLEKRLER